MNFLLSTIFIFIGVLFYGTGFSQILMSLFIGIPMFRYAIFKNVIEDDSPNYYILSIITWIVIIICVTGICYLYFPMYQLEMTISLIIGILFGINIVVKNYHIANWTEFKNKYKDYLVANDQKLTLVDRTNNKVKKFNAKNFIFGSGGIGIVLVLLDLYNTQAKLTNNIMYNLGYHILFIFGASLIFKGIIKSINTDI